MGIEVRDHGLFQCYDLCTACRNIVGQVGPVLLVTGLTQMLDVPRTESERLSCGPTGLWPNR